MSEKNPLADGLPEEIVAQWMPNKLFSRREFVRLFSAAALSTAGLAALAACGQQAAPAPTVPAGSQAPAPAKKSARTLKTGYLVASATHHAGLAMAREKGFFLDEGIQPQWGEYAAGAALVQAVTSGDVDFGVCGVYPALMGRAQGVDLRILASSNLEGSILVVGPNIKDIKDLNGKKVATPGIAAIQDSLLMLVEEKNNIKTEHFYVKVTDMPTYLKNGEIAGYIVWEPTGSAGLEMSGGRVLLTSKDIRPKHQCCVLVASGKLLQSEPDTVLSIVKAYEKGVKYAQEHPDEFDQYVAKDAATTVAVAKKAAANAIYVYPSFIPNEELKFTVDTLTRFKKIQAGQISDTDKFIKDNYIDSFVKKVST